MTAILMVGAWAFSATLALGAETGFAPVTAPATVQVRNVERWPTVCVGDCSGVNPTLSKPCGPWSLSAAVQDHHNRRTEEP